VVGPQNPLPKGYNLRFSMGSTVTSDPVSIGLTDHFLEIDLLPDTVYSWQLIPVGVNQATPANPCSIQSFTTAKEQIISNFPYSEDFEEGQGGWITQGLVSLCSVLNFQSVVLWILGIWNSAENYYPRRSFWIKLLGHRWTGHRDLQSV
jgi:hypothetical protein